MSTTATARPTATQPTSTRPATPSPAAPTHFPQDDCPTEVLPAVAPVPTRRSIFRAATATATATAAAQPESTPFADWRDALPTRELPAVSSDTGRPAIGTRRSRRPRVSTLPKPTGGRVARHLRAALAGLLIAAALLTGLSGYAAAGISSARQAALAERDAQAARTAQATEQSAPTTTAPTGQAGALAEQWVVEGTTAAAPSPLDLPRCTTSPDTPLPCLATISPSQTRAVVLEEDASLTALVRR